MNTFYFGNEQDILTDNLGGRMRHALTHASAIKSPMSSWIVTVEARPKIRSFWGLIRPYQGSAREMMSLS